MIIDFHTHVFPEKIAASTIAKMEKQGDVTARLDGTLNALKNSMKKAGVDYSVVLPVATRPEQFQTINRYAHEIDGKDGIISFGGIHPNTLHYKEELEQIKALGLRGIKLHPDYQHTFFKDEKYLRLMRYAVELELIILVHAGIDTGLPVPIHCPPDQIAYVIKELEASCRKKPKLVLAHGGGYGLWDQVEELVVGKEVYIDLSFAIGKEGMPVEQLIRMIRNHGADKILFATDSPWRDQQEDIAIFKALPLTFQEKKKIFGENAKKLLAIL